ncbi:hypothetical protein LAZ67_10004167 [Cordylochernes scorpioides]|uniref:Cuticle protein 14 n=1 Tax=Cordylochernes scorpioides TaxID=51811 RepID=A0ABY6KY03_9ARAC|nr:hypothetical protein LAZ67_10004167 [Cordylochernes scorpioides]
MSWCWQVLAVLLSVVAASRALPLLHSAAVVAPVYGTGASSQFRTQDNLGNYAFGYDEGHLTGGTFRRESGSNGVKVGSYGLRDADGRMRVVNYVADAAGFRADIKTNEPGVEPKDPAATLINKTPVAIAAPALAVAPAAPLALAPAAPALAVAPAPLAVAPAAPLLHAAPYAPIAHAASYAPIAHAAPYAPIAHAASIAHAAPIAYAAPFAHAAPLASGYSYSTLNGASLAYAPHF